MLDACYHEASAESPAYVRPSVERAPPNETVEFALVNRSEGALTFGPYYFRVWREDGGDWVDLGASTVPDLGYSLPPGETYAWTAVVDPEGGGVFPADRNAEGNTVAFAPGRCCFGIESVTAQPTETDGDADSLGTLGCLFEVTEP